MMRPAASTMIMPLGETSTAFCSSSCDSVRSLSVWPSAIAWPNCAARVRPNANQAMSARSCVSDPSTSDP